MTTSRSIRVLVRGGGDLGSGAIWRLARTGFPVVVTELERPLAVRRTVAFASAIPGGSVIIQGIRGVRSDVGTDPFRIADDTTVPVVAAEAIPDFPEPPHVVVDARLAKRRLDTTIDDAEFVVGIGPGFTAGVDCHAVVETMRGHDLGRVIWDGAAAPNTGIPGTIGGVSADRVVRADREGTVAWTVDFGDVIDAGASIGHVDDRPIVSPIAGTVRGLIAPGPVWQGLKIGDIDPRIHPHAVTTISDKSLAVGGGVLEAVMSWLHRTR